MISRSAKQEFDVRRSTFDGNGKSVERPNFEKLEVWQLAHRLCVDIYGLTRDFPAEERYRLTDQICRAASSVPANIAEGEGRYQINDQIHFLHIARGSLSELRYFLVLARDLGLVKADQEEELGGLASKLHAKLHAFIGSKRRLSESFVERRTSNVERNSKNCFTLVELLVVMSMMLIMLAVAVPSLKYAKSNAVSSGSDRLIDNLMWARAKAITSRTRVRFVFADINNGLDGGALGTGAQTNMAVFGRQSYAAYLWATNTADVGTNWIQVGKWETLPLGAYFSQFPTNYTSSPLTVPHIPFCTNLANSTANASWVTNTMIGIEFKSTGQTTSPADIDIVVAEGIVVGSQIAYTNKNNAITNRVFTLTGKAKELR